MRLHALLDVRELLHERLVDVQATARVDDQDVLAVLLGLVERPPGDLHRVLVDALLVDRRARLGADLDQLLDGGRAVDVAGGDGHGRVVLLLEQLRQLGRGGRLAGALQAGHQDHGRWARRERDPRRLAAHQRGQLVVDDLDDLLARVELLGDLDPERALLDRARELLDDLEVDVGLEQRETDLAHGLVDVVLGQRAALTDARQRALKLLRERIEHGVRLYPAVELDLLVIGSGPGGQRAAIQAAKLGKRVAVAERRNRLGGVSIHTGTIPSKTLRQATLEQLATRPLDVLDPTRVEETEQEAIQQLLDRAAAVVAAETQITREQFRRNRVGLLQGARHVRGRQHRPDRGQRRARQGRRRS